MATATVMLEDAEREMKKLSWEIEQADKQSRYFDKEAKDLQSKKIDLTTKINDLQSEIQQLEEELERQERLTSSSRDARKMYGDMTPGDISHQDVILQYTNHFKDAFRNMPKALPQHDKYKVWQMCADIVEETFKQNRESIISTMVESLGKALLTNTDNLTDEIIDLHRAFKMLVNDIKEEELKQIRSNVTDEEKDSGEIFDFVMDVIKNLDPSDYIYFLENGELMERKLECPKTEKKQMPSAENSLKNKVCPACKKNIKEIELPQYHLSEHWHREHMFCACCTGMVQGLDQFIFYNYHTYCFNCFCKVCGNPIKNETDAVMTEIGKLHSTCFRCHVCHGNDISLIIVNNHLICQHCYKMTSSNV